VLIGHGGGQRKKEPGVLSRAFPYVTSCGFAVASIDAPGVGGRPEHPEIRRLVAGMTEREAAGEPAGPAWPVEFVMQWDDAGHPRDSMLTLFDALGSAEKTLHASPGSHFEVPDFEIGSSVRFFARHLGRQGAAI
jgi:hypothetical protein